MSKHGKKKGRKRSKRRPNPLILLCPGCLKEHGYDTTPETLIGRLADALNALDGAGMRPKVHSEFIIAEGERGGGFVLPPLSGSGWTVHMVTYNPNAFRLPRREDELPTDS